MPHLCEHRYIGGRRALFLDEISTGLDSATLFTIIKWLSQVCVHRGEGGVWGHPWGQGSLAQV